MKIQKSKKGSTTVEAALVFPIVLVLLVLFEYVLKMGQIRAVVRHTASAGSVVEQVGAVCAPRYDPDVNHLFIRGRESSVNYIRGTTPLGGSVMIVDSSAEAKVAIPFINKTGIKCRAALKIPIYDRDFEEDDSNGGEGSVWSLPSFDSGRRIEDAFGGNLPDKFEALDIFTGDGHGVKIVSVNVTKKTYAESGGFYRVIEKAINDIADFKGDEEDGVCISGDEVLSKSVWVVIPEGVLTERQQEQFDKAVQYGGQKGVEVKLIEYQKVLEDAVGE